MQLGCNLGVQIGVRTRFRSVDLASGCPVVSPGTPSDESLVACDVGFPFGEVRVPREIAWAVDSGLLVTRDWLEVTHDADGNVKDVGKAGEAGWNTATNSEAHRRNVLLQADQRRLEDRWALRTGSVSGVGVLDWDGPDGLATLDRLGLESTLTTPDGGAHTWFRRPERPIGSAGYDSAGRFPGMEVKGDGKTRTF